MHPTVFAKSAPDRLAYVMAGTGQAVTYRELDERSNQGAQLFRALGLRPGDGVAIMMENHPIYYEVLWAAQRAGLRYTAVSSRLTAGEVEYIVSDSGAKAFIASQAMADVALEVAARSQGVQLLMVDAALDPFASFEAERAKHPITPIPDETPGGPMLYSSGTTGRPKGVHKPNAQAIGGFDAIYDRAVDKHICTGPAYHASPLAGDIRRALNNGVPTVLMDKWDTEFVLKTIQDQKVTRGHFVPIMFQRMLALPEEVRAKYDLSFLRRITHGAAPCPPEVKRAMIEWLGPILYEYYAGSEGGVGFTVTSEQWLARPGTVGRRPHKDAAKILDDEGNECPPGVPGHIYLSLKDQGGFSYWKDDTKTYANRRGDYFTMGDIGYLDEDDWLFLTGRSAETIIAGGVNIYPQEIDNELIKHPAVEDSCCVGIPHEEWGEEVRAVIQLREGYEPSEELKREILDYAARVLAKYKVPRGIDFVDDLPRSEAGKIQRNKVRAPYWAGRSRAI